MPSGQSVPHGRTARPIRFFTRAKRRSVHQYSDFRPSPATGRRVRQKKNRSGRRNLPDLYRISGGFRLPERISPALPEKSLHSSLKTSEKTPAPKNLPENRKAVCSTQTAHTTYPPAGRSYRTVFSVLLRESGMFQAEMCMPDGPGKRSKDGRCESAFVRGYAKRPGIWRKTAFRGKRFRLAETAYIRFPEHLRPGGHTVGSMPPQICPVLPLRRPVFSKT